MAADCGLELKKHNVAFVSLWPGPVKTEHMLNVTENIAEDKKFETAAGPESPVCHFLKKLKNNCCHFITFCFDIYVIFLYSNKNSLRKFCYDTTNKISVPQN